MNKFFFSFLDYYIALNANDMEPLYQDLLKEFAGIYYKALSNGNLTFETAQVLIDALDDHKKINYLILEFSPEYPDFTDYLHRITMLDRFTLSALKITIAQFIIGFANMAERKLGNKTLPFD